MVSFLKTLTNEKVVFIRGSGKITFPLKEGIVRLVDKKGKTLGLVLDQETIEELEEELLASNPHFIASLAASRRSGRVSSSAIKKKIGL